MLPPPTWNLVNNSTSGLEVSPICALNAAAKTTFRMWWQQARWRRSLHNFCLILKNTRPYSAASICCCPIKAHRFDTFCNTSVWQDSSERWSSIFPWPSHQLRNTQKLAHSIAWDEDRQPIHMLLACQSSKSSPSQWTTIGTSVVKSLLIVTKKWALQCFLCRLMKDLLMGIFPTLQLRLLAVAKRTKVAFRSDILARSKAAVWSGVMMFVRARFGWDLTVVNGMPSSLVSPSSFALSNYSVFSVTCSAQGTGPNSFNRWSRRISCSFIDFTILATRCCFFFWWESWPFPRRPRPPSHQCVDA